MSSSKLDTFDIFMMVVIGMLSLSFLGAMLLIVYHVLAVGIGS